MTEDTIEGLKAKINILERQLYEAEQERKLVEQENTQLNIEIRDLMRDIESAIDILSRWDGGG